MQLWPLACFPDSLPRIAVVAALSALTALPCANLVRGQPSEQSTRQMPSTPVNELFQHTRHVDQEQLACAECHPRIFQEKWGAARASGAFRHSAFAEAKTCGSCHNGNFAFSSANPGQEEACLRCHGSDMKPPESLLFQKAGKPATFNHKAHGERIPDCARCHIRPFALRAGNAETGTDFSMESIRAGRYCGTCHDSGTAFAPKNNCIRCHEGHKDEEESKE